MDLSVPFDARAIPTNANEQRAALAASFRNPRIFEDSDGQETRTHGSRRAFPRHAVSPCPRSRQSCGSLNALGSHSNRSLLESVREDLYKSVARLPVDPTEFEIVLPPEMLRPFLRRYLYAARPSDGPVTIRPKPTGYTYFSNFLQVAPDGYFTINGKKNDPAGRWYLPGQIVDHEIEVRIERSDLVIFCEFAATGRYRLLGLPGDAYIGESPTLAQACPEYEPVACACFVAGPDAPRFVHVEEINDFFSRLAEQARPPDPEVERAVAMFEAANGAVRVAAVCAEVGLSPRQLNRRFTHLVGVGPKFFGQILQINWVVSLLYAHDMLSLTEIAHEAGFYDQAHFNHAMQQFFSEGPREFLQSDHVFFKSFLGASRKFGPSAARVPPQDD
jgi:AraC-like DNA-binding protein